MKRIFTAVACVVLLITAGDGWAAPDTLDFPTGSLTLSAPDDGERAPTLSSVNFPHSLHFSYACKDCHHTWDGESPVQSCSTEGCHDKLWAPKPGTIPLDQRRVKSLAGAFHEACRDCHRDELAKLKAQGVKDAVSGPIECEGCHPTPHSDPVTPDGSMSVALGTLTIEPPEGVEAKQGAVTFPHGEHFKFACQSCHHDWDGESDIETCTSCHDETKPSGTRNINDPDNVMYYLSAYHNNCLKCHRRIKKELDADPSKAKGQVVPPLACDGCHS